MILTGKRIVAQFRRGKINLQPFDAKRISTNAYDLSLGDRFIQYTDPVIDPAKPPAYKEIIVGPEGILLEKNAFLLGHSQEIVGSDYFVPKIHAKSSIARLGLFVHATADLIQLGAHGQVSFHLWATLPVVLYPGMLVGQVSFWQPQGEITLYDGKYQGAKGPQPSKLFLDFAPSNTTRAPKITTREP